MEPTNSDGRSDGATRTAVFKTAPSPAREVERRHQWVAPVFARPGETLVVWVEPALAADAELKLKEWELGLKYRVVTGNEYRGAVLNLEDQAGMDQSAAAGT